MQKWVVVCWALLALAAAEECPDGGRCDDGQTCCNDPENGFECCPFDEAECCSDHTHCCPAGTICDEDKSSCVNATTSIPWTETASAAQPRLSKSFRMIKAYMGEDDENVCPDQSRCPPEFSCLKALTKYGCCPLAQGIPCSDGKHCCPENHECSADSRSCIRKDLVSTILCSDGVSECPDQSTCCENPDGTWGCCPIPKAVCCEDKLHCCPEESTCDVEQSKCISLSTKKEMPMWAKLPARMRAEWENKKDLNGAEICFFPENSVPCDDTVACPDGNTCCKTKDGGWACCPMPEAVCCEDHVHCCPKGKKCNLAAQTCEDNTCSIPWFKKMPTFPRQSVQQQNVPCDATTSCPDDSTCCKTNEGGWACCPLPEVQLYCSAAYETLTPLQMHKMDFINHIHCCPKGNTCNLPAQTCDSNSKSIPWVEKIPAIPRGGAQAGNVPCDTTTSCPDGSTCCKNKMGEWACCPLPEAVCCDDHEHCCPHGTTCDPSGTACISESGSTPMMEKIPALTTPAFNTGDITATDSQVTNPETTEKEPDNDVDALVNCDPHTSCPRDTTCCFMTASQKWGCCPLPEAVCCADGNHCCPTNYKCNEEQTSCVKGEVVIPWYTKLPATSTLQDEPNSVQCDGLNQCPQQTTCCRLFTGEWGCCPMQDAVCCQDQEHCCPQGYTCNILSKSCQKVVMLQLETIPLTPVYLPERQTPPPPSKQNDIQCDDKTSCKDEETCCRMSATKWGCCPSPNAVCCSDMQHCCPTGYTCTEGGACIQSTKFFWNNWHEFLANKKRALSPHEIV
uniref:Granulins domain-containing protein n=1 Tax=Echeneis naucrates TaxID=173247 RepID=A0A665TPF0_ECHNA